MADPPNEVVRFEVLLRHRACSPSYFEAHRIVAVAIGLVNIDGDGAPSGVADKAVFPAAELVLDDVSCRAYVEDVEAAAKFHYHFLP